MSRNPVRRGLRSDGRRRQLDRLRDQRQGEHETGAAAGRVLGGHGAAVRLGDLADDRQAEARARQPARRRRAVEAVEDVRQVGRRRCPGPWSRTASSPSATGPRSRPPGGLHLAALSSRLRDRPLEPRRARRARRVGSSVGVELDGRRRARARALDGVARRARRGARPRARSPARSPRASSTRSPTSTVSSSSWATTSASSARARSSRQRRRALEHLDVRAHARRAACAARARRRRRAGAARATSASSASSIALKLPRAGRARRRRATSMRRLRSRVAATCSAAPRQPPHRRERRAGDEQPSAAASAMPAEADQRRADQREPVERAVDLVQRARDLHAPPGAEPRRCSTRTCVAADVDVGEERPCRAGAVARAGRRRPRRPPARIGRRRRPDDLAYAGCTRRRGRRREPSGSPRRRHAARARPGCRRSPSRGGRAPSRDCACAPSVRSASSTAPRSSSRDERRRRRGRERRPRPRPRPPASERSGGARRLIGSRST